MIEKQNTFVVSQCLNLVSNGPFPDVMQEEENEPSGFLNLTKRFPQPAILAASLSIFCILNTKKERKILFKTC